MNRIAIVGVAFWLAVTVAAYAQRPAFADALDEFLKQREAHDFAGMVVVERGGEIIYERYSGMANQELGIPWSEDTVYCLGSITKPMTAAAVTKLHVDGKLSVEDSIATWIDGLSAEKQAITVHYLLTHSAGVPDIFGGDFDPKATREWFLDQFRACDLLWGPEDFGKKYQYSNAGYSLLAVIIEEVSGIPYEEYMKSALFEPMGMTLTGYTNARWKPEDFAHGYRDGVDTGVVVLKNALPDGPSWNLRANGGISTTVGDMRRWIRAMQDYVVYSPEMIRLIETPHVREGESARSYYGYGWAMYTTRRGTKCVTHNGGDGISFADCRRYVDEDTLILIASNEAKANGERFVGKIVDFVFPASESDPFP
jgi:CubicO group peptidase (beta-lactamase class C family)